MVTAVAEAEATLQTVVAVRERIIEAYKDILRMPICTAWRTSMGEELNEITVLELGREATWVMMLVAGPLLVVGTAVGVVVALLQALTTIQEMTLTFVPKIVAMLLALVLFLPFMLTTLIEFTQRLFERIAQVG